MDWSAGDGVDAVGFVERMCDVGFAGALNLLADQLGIAHPFESASRSSVRLDVLGRWPGAAVEVPPEPEQRRTGRIDGGSIANFTGVSDPAADGWIRATVANLREDLDLQAAIAEWRGLSVKTVAALAGAGLLGAAEDDDGRLHVWLPCSVVGDNIVRAQVRKKGPREPGCEYFWPERSEHKPGPWMARNTGTRLYVGEGWGDVAAAVEIGGDGMYVATLGVGVRKLEALTSVEAVIILRQNEDGDANARWARSIRALYPTVSVKSAVPPGGVKDWNDVLKRHGPGIAQALFADACQVRDDPVIADKTPEMARRRSEGLNDALAAEVFGEIHGERYRHDDQWYEWRGGPWEPVPVKGVIRSALDVEAQLAREAMELIRRSGKRDNDDGRKLSTGATLMQFARGRGNAKAATACLALACTEPGISVSFDESARDRYQLPVANGMLDLRLNHELWRPIRRDDLVRGLAGAAFDEDAECPRWIQFMRDICQGDTGIMKLIQRWVGYCLTGETSEQKVLFLYGLGANGKSTLVSMMQRLMGSYAVSVPQRMILLDKMGQAASDLDFILLRGARLAVAPEVEKAARLAEAQVKQISGSDQLRGRAHYKQSESFWPTHKLTFFGNHKPTLAGGDEGLKRRFLMIYLRQRFEGAKKVSGLGEAMWREESSGILNWAIAGCWDWQRQGLNPPQGVLDEVKEYLDQSDAIGSFLRENIKQVPGLSIQLSELRRRLAEWARESGENWLVDISTRRLRREMEERDWQVKVDRKGKPYISGMWDTQAEDEEQEEDDS